MQKSSDQARQRSTSPVLHFAFCILHLFFLLAAAASNAQTPPPSDVSTIVIPIHVSLAPLLPLVESQVPKAMQKLDAYELDPDKRFGLKYKVDREAIGINMVGSGLHATATVHYALEGCARALNPINGQVKMWPCVSCGFGEPMRDALIYIDSHLDVDADWRFRSTTKARPVEFPNKCGVTFANIDVSNWKIGPIVNDQLRIATKTIDANTPKLTNIRTNAAQVWTSLQTPVQLADRTWLVVDPLDVAVGPLRGSGLSLDGLLALQARARVVLGDRPPTTTRPLPKLHVVTAPGSGIRVPFDVEVPYPEASRILTEQFGGRKYDVEGHDLIVDTIRVLPGEQGKLTIEVGIDYRGGTFRSYRGLVYLEGTPIFDAASTSVSFGDLDYSLDPKRKNPFLRLANRMVHDTLRARLRENAKWSIAAQLATMRTEIERGITRPLASNVSLKGKVDSLQPLSATTQPDRIVVHVVATGSASVAVR